MRVTVTDGPLQFEGAKDFRLRVVLAVLARRPVVIERIRSKDESPGVRGEAIGPAARAKRARTTAHATKCCVTLPDCRSLMFRSGPLSHAAPAPAPAHLVVPQTTRLASSTCLTR